MELGISPPSLEVWQLLPAVEFVSLLGLEARVVLVLKLGWNAYLIVHFQYQESGDKLH